MSLMYMSDIRQGEGSLGSFSDKTAEQSDGV